MGYLPATSPGFSCRKMRDSSKDEQPLPRFSDPHLEHKIQSGLHFVKRDVFVMSAEVSQTEVLERQLNGRSFRAMYSFLDCFFSTPILLKHMIETSAAFACTGEIACSCKPNPCTRFDAIMVDRLELLNTHSLQR